MNDDVRTRTLELMKKYNVEPQKKFSQNFLFDQGIIRKIAKSVPFDKSQEVIEIGPGLGSLTFELKKEATHLTAIDFDRDMVRVLKEEIKDPNVEIVQEDFLKTDLKRFHVKQASYVGNLPYEISRDVIKKILSDDDFIYFGFMLQKDLADKLFYKDKDPINNPYSVFIALRGNLERLVDLNPGSFYPSPKISSSFLVFKPTDNKYAKSEVFDFICKVFKNPRKNLNNNLKMSNMVGLLNTLPTLNIPSSKRPHELLLDDWKKMIDSYFKLSA